MTDSSSRLRALFYIATMDAGGAERQVLQMIQRLDRTRFEPHLGLAVRRGPLLLEVPDDVPVHACQEPDDPPQRFGLSRWRRWRKLAGILRRERIDVIYDRTFQATLDAGPATWFRPTPRISAVAADPQIQMDLYFPHRQWLWRRFARRIYRTADVVLANSEGLRQRVIDYLHLPAEQVRVMTNLLDIERIESLAVSQSLNPDGRFRVLTVGRIDDHKGHRDLLEAIRILVQERGHPEILWQILGDGTARMSLMDEVQRLNLGASVEWLGIVTNPYPYFRSADLFCLPSLTEGSPNVLLEALALETPVISTDCPSGPREILEDGRWGALVPMQNPPALADAIADRMANPESWRQRAREAQAVIRERYDAAFGVRKVEELLLEVANLRSARVS